MMNNRLLYVLGLIFFFLFSCVREDDTRIKINFSKIVGNYSGQLKQCQAPDLLSDTLCTAGLDNIFKVIVQDFYTINISNQSGLYDTLKMTYIQTDTLPDGMTHYFEKDNINSLITLKFTENTNSIIFEDRVKTDINVSTSYFVGKK